MSGKSIRIRMYRVGFGDCFLLSFPGTDSQNTENEQHILVDCGVHSGGDIGTIEKAVNDVAEITHKKLAVIIATHAHRDHISGFNKFDGTFSQFEVGEVWLPWTWDDKNKKAVKLQKRQAALTEQLFEHFSARRKEMNRVAWFALENLNVSGNKRAVELLKSGFGNSRTKIRYMKAGDTLNSGRTPIPGLSVRIMGPPESEEFLAKMNPPKNQRYLRLIDDQATFVNSIQPFLERWRAYPSYPGPRLDAEEKERLRNLADISLDDLAFFLDSARNNESLVTLFIFHNKQYLLFPGDAQYGNWKWWLESEDSEGILSKINFFKLAHHGSENATPKAALERMNDGEFAAMVSTQSVPWSSIPRPQLMSRVSEKTKKRIVRSDWLSVDGAPKPLAHAMPPFSSRLPNGFRKGDFWFDYVIEL